jgi:hypothetical protein
MIQSRILSQHPQYTVKMHSIHATLNRLMFSVCVQKYLWRVILPTNSSPLVHLVVNIPPCIAPEQLSPLRDFLVACGQYQGLSPGLRSNQLKRELNSTSICCEDPETVIIFRASFTLIVPPSQINYFMSVFVCLHITE